MIEVSRNIRDYLSELFGTTTAELYFSYLNSEHQAFLRKARRYPENKLFKDLSAYKVSLHKHPGVDPAYLIQNGEEITGKTIQHVLGMYYLQSLSSMIPPIVLNAGSGDTVLDLCAAPGSKTTQISEMMDNKGTLISNEISVDRVKTLVHNIDRMNLINIGVLNQKGELLSKLYSNYFDKILVDAPCSALGVLQKKQEVSSWWNEDRVAVLSSIQLKLLIAGIKMLKPGGELVYSTCTLTPEENELVLNIVLNKYPVEILDISLPVKSVEGLTLYKGEKLHPDLHKARRILPWEVNSEGFFVIKLRKFSATACDSSGNKKTEPEFISCRHKLIKEHLAELSEHYGIEKSLWEGLKFLFRSNDIFFTADGWNAENPGLYTRIGTRFGTIDKNSRLQLHTYAAQYFSSEIQNNLYHINDPKELKVYIAGGVIKTDTPELKIMKVVKYNDMVMGTAVPVQNGLKSQFPKSKRMQEIIIA